MQRRAAREISRGTFIERDRKMRREAVGVRRRLVRGIRAGHFRDSVNTGRTRDCPAARGRDNSCDRLTSESALESPTLNIARRERRHRAARPRSFRDDGETKERPRFNVTLACGSVQDTPRVRRALRLRFPAHLRQTHETSGRRVYVTIRIHMQILEWSFIATASAGVSFSPPRSISVGTGRSIETRAS